MDLFEEAGQHYLVMTDEFLGWPVLFPMGKDTTAPAIISRYREYFTQVGVPTVVHPDNGRQLVATAVKTFLAKWGATLEPSAPRMPESNGRAEAAVKATKRMVRGATSLGDTGPDPDKMGAALLAYRNQGRYGGRSPAELVFGHLIKEPLSTHRASMEDPRWAKDPEELDRRAESNKEKLRETYDAHARDYEPFPVGTPVAVLQRGANHKPLFRNTGWVTAVKPKHLYQIRQDKGGPIDRHRTHLLRRHVEGFTTGTVAPVFPVAVQAPPPPPQAAPPPQRQQAAPLGRPAPGTAAQSWPLPRAPSTRVRKPNPWVTGKYWVPK